MKLENITRSGLKVTDLLKKGDGRGFPRFKPCVQNFGLIKQNNCSNIILEIKIGLKNCGVPNNFIDASCVG